MRKYWLNSNDNRYCCWVLNQVNTKVKDYGLEEILIEIKRQNRISFIHQGTGVKPEVMYIQWEMVVDHETS